MVGWLDWLGWLDLSEMHQKLCWLLFQYSIDPCKKSLVSLKGFPRYGHFMILLDYHFAGSAYVRRLQRNNYEDSSWSVIILQQFTDQSLWKFHYGWTPGSYDLKFSVFTQNFMLFLIVSSKFPSSVSQWRDSDRLKAWHERDRRAGGVCGIITLEEKCHYSGLGYHGDMKFGANVLQVVLY